MARAGGAHILLLTSAILKIQSQEQTLASLGNIENFNEPLEPPERKRLTEKCSVCSEVDN